MPAQGGRRPPPPPSRSGFATAALVTLGLIVAGVGAAAAYLYIAPPVDFIRDQLVQQVKARTGRDLVITGPARIAFYPSLSVNLADVSLSAPPGMAGAPTVRMKRLDVAVQLMPLLSRQAVVERVVLHAPEFDLRVDKGGRKSWEFAASEMLPVRYAQGPSPTRTDAAPAAPPAARTAMLEQLSLSDVRTESGVVRYTDERSGASHVVSEIDMRLSAPAIASPLAAKGTFVWQGQKIAVDGRLTALKQVLANQPAKLALDIKHPHGAATFDGSVNAAASAAEGALKANAPSLRQLAQSLGAALPASSGFGAAAIDGQVRAAATSVAMSDATMTLDGMTAKGSATVELSGARPLVKANLKISELDLNRYVVAADGTSAPPPKPAAAQPAAPAAAPPATAPAAPASGDAIEELLKRGGAGGPQVKGFTKRDAWSEEPINVAALGAADVDAKLAIAKLTYDDLKVGPTQLAVALKDRVLKTTIEDVQLYQGRGRGVISLDAGASTPVLGANMLVENVVSQQLLKDAADLDWLAGTGKLQIAIAGQGLSQRKIVETLNGKADFMFTNGAIVGWNFPGLVRNLQQGKFSGLSKSPSEKTDFSELSAGWSIANGIATNQDLKLTSPLMRLTGAGRVLLPTREIDYVAKPKFVASLEGQGAAAGAASGLEVPVKITGSWRKPHLTPDVGGVLKDPGQAVGAIKEIGKQLKTEQGREALKKLLGKDADGNPVKPRQLLDKYLQR